MKWLEDIFPDNQQWKQFSRDLALVSKSVGESIEIGEFFFKEETNARIVTQLFILFKIHDSNN